MTPQTGYRDTSHHADVLRFIDELKAIQPVFRVEPEPESDDGLVRWGYVNEMLKPGAILPVRRLRSV
jgi:hypothetical protein